ncbi:hypothetical protein COBT_000419 [Conglomerata obtusa]
MNYINEEEMKCIHEMISTNQRLDNRSFTENRSTSITNNIYPHSDASIKLHKGQSIIEINLKYREKNEELPSINILSGIDGSIPFNGKFFIAYEKKVKQFLNTYNLDLNIELNVIRDDGSIYGMFHDGIRHIFKNIIIPDIESLDDEFIDSLKLPICLSYAVFNDLYVLDPCKYEELSCDALVHVFVDDCKVVAVNVENATKLDPFVLNDIICKIN